MCVLLRDSSEFMYICDEDSSEFSLILLVYSSEFVLYETRDIRKTT